MKKTERYFKYCFSICFSLQKFLSYLMQQLISKPDVINLFRVTQLFKFDSQELKGYIYKTRIFAYIFSAVWPA